MERHDASRAHRGVTKPKTHRGSLVCEELWIGSTNPVRFRGYRRDSLSI
jgi:hypothetical protein